MEKNNKIKWNVASCKHNSDDCCCLNEVKISCTCNKDDCACKDDTICKSFEEE